MSYTFVQLIHGIKVETQLTYLRIHGKQLIFASIEVFSQSGTEHLNGILLEISLNKHTGQGPQTAF